LSNRKLILVVDDDASMLRCLKRLLRAHGYDSMLFQSAEAFEKHDDFTGAICAVLDVQLNGVSGIDVRCRLASAGISLPIIYITANDKEATRDAAMESGCVAYLTKPFSAKSLIDPIERLVGLA
jgi:FixJ family two-component response regulator